MVAVRGGFEKSGEAWASPEKSNLPGLHLTFFRQY